MKNKTFLVTLKGENIPNDMSSAYLANYIREAVQHWCKGRHPWDEDYILGEDATVKPFPIAKKKK